MVSGSLILTLGIRGSGLNFLDFGRGFFTGTRQREICESGRNSPPQHSKMIVILIDFNASRINRNVKQLIIRDLVLSRGFNTPDELFVI